ncbi:hypothetical protein ABZX98_07435 [Streptomyces sp. NPDC002992]|uniref:hypothetical protein n=1 Tax=Streptomyces sp. NPDC002992 TaxID=3154273 RepID=UPI0033A66681
MEHQPFPLDLVRTQTAWTATYAALAAPGPGGTTVLRRRLLRLSTRLYWHPHWSALDAGPAGRVELRALVREGCGERVAP